jgi:hypothetical protein
LSPTVNYHGHKSPPLVPVLSHINPVHTIPTLLRFILILYIYLRLGLPRTPCRLSETAYSIYSQISSVSEGRLLHPQPEGRSLHTQRLIDELLIFLLAVLYVSFCPLDVEWLRQFRDNRSAVAAVVITVTTISVVTKGAVSDRQTISIICSSYQLLFSVTLDCTSTWRVYETGAGFELSNANSTHRSGRDHKKSRAREIATEISFTKTTKGQRHHFTEVQGWQCDRNVNEKVDMIRPEQIPYKSRVTSKN